MHHQGKRETVHIKAADNFDSIDATGAGDAFLAG
jgi:sugar/nucleoside kinase (ribokinase family)